MPNAKTNTATKKSTTVAKGKAPAKQVAKENTAPAEPVVVNPKCAQGRTQVGKIQRRMLTKISRIGKKPAGPNRLKRWDNYRKGMTLQHCKETDGLDHLDIGFYVERGFMDVQPATDKEWEAAIKAQETAKAKAAA